MSRQYFWIILLIHRNPQKYNKAYNAQLSTDMSNKPFHLFHLVFTVHEQTCQLSSQHIGLKYICWCQPNRFLQKALSILECLRFWTLTDKSIHSMYSNLMLFEELETLNNMKSLKINIFFYHTGDSSSTPKNKNTSSLMCKLQTVKR